MVLAGTAGTVGAGLRASSPESFVKVPCFVSGGLGGWFSFWVFVPAGGLKLSADVTLLLRLELLDASGLATCGAFPPIGVLDVGDDAVLGRGRRFAGLESLALTGGDLAGEELADLEDDLSSSAGVCALDARRALALVWRIGTAGTFLGEFFAEFFPVMMTTGGFAGDPGITATPSTMTGFTILAPLVGV